VDFGFHNVILEAVNVYEVIIF